MISNQWLDAWQQDTAWNDATILVRKVPVRVFYYKLKALFICRQEYTGIFKDVLRRHLPYAIYTSLHIENDTMELKI